ncbi:MAG: cysteine desulfurase NifS [Candidatus Saccharimonadales bacterium]
MTKLIYFDYAAATPMHPDVIASMQPYLTTQFFNPSATYLAAKTVAQDVARARRDIALHLGAKSSEIIFTAGGTEANNLAIHGIMRQFKGCSVLYSAIEHDSIREPSKSYHSLEIPVLPDGCIDLARLQQQITDKTVLISVMYANNEIGTIQPLRKIHQIIKTVLQDRRYRNISLPLFFHTDACQATNYLDMKADSLGVDIMTLNAGKIYGPKQSGALFVRSTVRMEPLITGGGQENNHRSGTENVPSIIGFAKAMSIVQTDRKAEGDRLRTLQNYFMSSLSECYPTTHINGSIKTRLPNNIHCTFMGYDNERLMMELDEKGILCAAGSACSASKEESSHVLRAIGLSDHDARSSLRFTMGRMTTRADIESLLTALKTIVK